MAEYTPTQIVSACHFLIFQKFILKKVGCVFGVPFTKIHLFNRQSNCIIISN